MPVRVELPCDDPIDCWTLIREIARAVVPDLNPRATDIECIVAKKPASLGVIGIGDMPFVEQELDNDDREYLRRVLPVLPSLEFAFPDAVANVFLDEFRALPDRPTWEPVLLTESRFLQEQNRIIENRWVVAGHHLRTLQQWLDLGRISAFYRKRVPTPELTVGALIPHSDVRKYLDHCDIEYVGKELAKSPSILADTQNERNVPAETRTLKETATLESPSMPEPTRPVLQVVQSDVTEDWQVEPVAIPPGPLLDIKEVAARTGISVSMLHERMRAGSKYYDPHFPPKIALGERTVRYSQAAIEDWVQSRLSAAAGQS